MRGALTFVAVLLAGLACAGASLAQGARGLDGYWLGMSVAEARAHRPDVRWPEDQSNAFLVDNAQMIIGNRRFGARLVFVNGTLAHIGVDQTTSHAAAPAECLSGLDQIVAELEARIGPLDAPPDANAPRQAPYETTQLPRGSLVRHWRTEETGVHFGAAYGVGAQTVEATVSSVSVSARRWTCFFHLSVRPPFAANPPAPEGVSFMTNMLWLERPTAGDFSRYYPPLGVEASAPGDVTLNCLVQEDGLLACEIVSESPEGWGFGAAALNLSRRFRSAPETRDGAATAGGRVRIPIRFRVN